MAARLAKAIAERDAGVVFDSGSLKVGEYLDRWLDAVRDTVRQRTWQRHEQVVRLHLKPVLGNVRLDRLSALQIQSLYQAKLNSGLSPRTVQIVHVTLHKALKQAVRWVTSDHLVTSEGRELPIMSVLKLEETGVPNRRIRLH